MTTLKWVMVILEIVGVAEEKFLTIDNLPKNKLKGCSSLKSKRPISTL